MLARKFAIKTALNPDFFVHFVFAAANGYELPIIGCVYRTVEGGFAHASNDLSFVIASSRQSVHHTLIGPQRGGLLGAGVPSPRSDVWNGCRGVGAPAPKMDMELTPLCDKT